MKKERYVCELKKTIEIEHNIIQKCIYEEKTFSLVSISESLIQNEKALFRDAINNGVFNLNALYKNFIDDNYQYYQEVQSHNIEEQSLDNGSILLQMKAFNNQTEVVKAYAIELKQTA